MNKLASFHFLNPNSTLGTSAIVQVPHFSLLLSLCTFSFVIKLEAFLAVQSLAVLAFSSFYFEDAPAIGYLAAFVIMIFLQKLKHLELTQF